MIRIAGVAVTPRDEYTIEKNATEERAGGSLTVFTSRQERFENYDLVEIIENGLDEQMLVQSDSVIKFDESRYEHSITLIEPAAKFDGFYPFDRTHSRAIPPRTLGEILKIYQTELKKYHNLKITFDDQAEWAQTFIRNKEYEGLNFSAILQDLFREIDARPVVRFQTPNWNIEPYFFNTKNNPIPASDYPTSQIARQNNMDYATKVKAKLKNAVYEMSDGVYFPSATGYILPKSSTPQKRESTLQYELDSGIVQILEAKVFDITFTSVNNIIQEEIEAEIDITPHVLVREEYETLPNVAFASQRGVHKKNSIFYNIGSNVIENLYDGEGSTIWVITTSVENLKQAISESADRDGLKNKEGYRVKTKTEEVKLRVKYIRQRDLDIVHHRQYLKNMNESTTIHNQSTSYVDVLNKKNNLKAISNRLGNTVKEESLSFDIGETPYQIGDYKDEYTIIKTKNTYRNTTILCEYVLAENFGNINAQTSLWREPSPFTRTQKTLTTNMIIEEFVEISRNDQAENTRLETIAKNNILATLDKTLTAYSPIANGVFRPLVSSANPVASNGVVMPVFTGAGGNINTFHVEFRDTYSAGRAYTESYFDGDFALEYIYTNSGAEGVKGELKDFRLFFTPDITYEDDGRYPLINNLKEYLDNAYTNTQVVDTIDKDINSRLAVTYNIHYITDSKDIVIGNAIAKYSRLVDTATIGTKKVYKRSTPYTIYDKTTTNQDTEINATWTVNPNNRQLTVTSTEQAEYYAIAYDNEILLAFNDGINAAGQETFYINFIANAERVLTN